MRNCKLIRTVQSSSSSFCLLFKIELNERYSVQVKEMKLGLAALNKHNVGLVFAYDDIYFHEVGFKDE